MKVEELISQPGSWLSRTENTGVVVSSRIRLARNLRNIPFPGWSDEAGRLQVWDSLRTVASDREELTDMIMADMVDITELDRQILFERHLISREHMGQGKGSGVIIRPDETVSLMVNEEDHLRLQAIHAGLDLETCWKAIDDIDSSLEHHIQYAFSPELGYLTACPSNVGTGMRASVMLHLPALVLMDEMSPIMKGMGKIGLAVRGLWGEGTDAAGNMFQVSNQITLGEKEADIIKNLEQIVMEVVVHEENARERLKQERETLVRDHVGRAYGILTQAHILSSKEALDLLSGLRLGIDLGILQSIDWSHLNELLILTQPGHLQMVHGCTLKARQRDKARAELVRNKLREAEQES